MSDASVDILVNGRCQTWVGALDRGVAYGDGVFETLAVIGGKALDLEAHLGRLWRGLDRLGITPIDPDLLKAEISGLVESCPRAVLKIIVTRGKGGRGYAPPRPADPTRILSLNPWPEFPLLYSQDGIDATICQARLARNPMLAGIKHLNRLENVLARMEWTNEFQEGLLLDTEGWVIEGVASNVFLVRAGELFTPDLSACGVEGVMRERILSVAREIGLRCEITGLRLSDFETADGAFFCNSLIGLWPVRQLGDYRYMPSSLVNRLNAHLKLEFLPGSGGL